MTNLEPQDARKIVSRLLERTKEGALEWDVFEFDSDEYVAYSESFKYYVAHRDWPDEPDYRLQIWRLSAADDGKSAQVEEIDSSVTGLADSLESLFSAAKTGAVNPEVLTDDILRDLE
jgi:hypothetical protein